MFSTDIKSIIDEELVAVGIDTPKVLLRLEKKLNNAFKEHLEKKYPNHGFRKMPSFCIGGGLIYKLIHNHIHNEGRTVEDILNTTDIDVFIFDNGYLNPHYLEDTISQVLEDTEEVLYNNDSKYFKSFKISAFFRGLFEGIKVELIFTNPKRIQSFDINNRNCFLVGGKIHATSSALEDIRAKRILITSVHTPANSLVRALTFSEQDNYSIADESIKLMKYFIKHLRINVSNEKIDELINSRKVSDTIKSTVRSRLKSIISDEDLTVIEFFRLDYSMSFDTHSRDNISELFKTEQERDNFINFNKEYLSNIILMPHFISVVSDNQDGYDYPFHPDTKFEMNQNNELSDDDIEDNVDLYWSKSMYDAISNYSPEINATEKYKEDFSIKVKVDVQKFLNLEFIYKKLYLPTFTHFNENLIEIVFTDFTKDTYNFSKVNKRIFEDLKDYSFNSRISHSNYFVELLDFENIKFNLLSLDFLLSCHKALIHYNTISSISEDSSIFDLDVFEQPVDEKSELDFAFALSGFLISILHYNMYSINTISFESLSAISQKRIAKSYEVFNNLKLSSRKVKVHKINPTLLHHFNTFLNSNLTSPSPINPVYSLDKHLIGSVDYTYDLEHSKLVYNGFETYNFQDEFFRGFFENQEEYKEADYLTDIDLFTNEFKEKFNFISVLSPTFLIQQSLMTKYPEVFGIPNNNSKTIAHLDHNIMSDGYYIDKVSGQVIRPFRTGISEVLKKFFDECVTIIE